MSTDLPYSRWSRALSSPVWTAALAYGHTTTQCSGGRPASGLLSLDSPITESHPLIVFAVVVAGRFTVSFVASPVVLLEGPPSMSLERTPCASSARGRGR